MSPSSESSFRVALCSLLSLLGACAERPHLEFDVVTVDAALADAAPDGASTQDGGAVDANVADAVTAEDAESLDAGSDAGPDADIDAAADAGPDACVPTEERCNGIDDDCDGEVDESTTGPEELAARYLDGDGDGYAASEPPAFCEAAFIPRRVFACPLAPGYADRLGDCDDRTSAASPGATELCDGIDNDCDDSIDEGAICPAGTGCSNGACVPCSTVDVLPATIDDEIVVCRGSRVETPSAGDVNIAEGGSLTVEGGAFVGFARDQRLIVRGTLVLSGIWTQSGERLASLGARENSPNPSQRWGGIDVPLDATLERQPVVRIDGGYLNNAVTALTWESDVLTIRNSLFMRSGHVFANNVNGGASADVFDSHFRRNDYVFGANARFERSHFLQNAIVFEGPLAGSSILSSSVVNENSVVTYDESGAETFDNLPMCQTLVSENIFFATSSTTYPATAHIPARFDAFECSFLDNDDYLEVGRGHELSITQSVICRNGVLDVIVGDTTNVDLSSNYWCTGDTSYIASRIYDNADLPARGVATTEPLLAGWPAAAPTP